jgi:hypothetical protein
VPASCNREIEGRLPAKPHFRDALAHSCCTQGYEPYGLHRARSTAQKFDERFVGFGYDRVSWFGSLNYLGWSFAVLHSAFLMDTSHPDSESRLQFVGDPMLRSCVEGLVYIGFFALAENGCLEAR